MLEALAMRTRQLTRKLVSTKTCFIPSSDLADRGAGDGGDDVGDEARRDVLIAGERVVPTRCHRTQPIEDAFIERAPLGYAREYEIRRDAAILGERARVERGVRVPEDDALARVEDEPVWATKPQQRCFDARDSSRVDACHSLDDEYRPRIGGMSHEETHDRRLAHRGGPSTQALPSDQTTGIRTRRGVEGSASKESTLVAPVAPAAVRIEVVLPDDVLA